MELLVGSEAGAVSAHVVHRKKMRHLSLLFKGVFIQSTLYRPVLRLPHNLDLGRYEKINAQFAQSALWAQFIGINEI